MPVVDSSTASQSRRGGGRKGNNAQGRDRARGRGGKKSDRDRSRTPRRGSVPSIASDAPRLAGEDVCEMCLETSTLVHAPSHSTYRILVSFRNFR